MPAPAISYPERQQRGFTLIELLMAIILIGILAINVLPKWLDTQGEQGRTVSDELVARLRLVQNMNMNEPATYCSLLRVEPGRFAHLSNADCSDPGPISGWSEAQQGRGRPVAFAPPITLKPSGNQPAATTFILSFDRMGRPKAPCVGGCQIQVGQNGTLYPLQIEPEGYIHALP